MNRLRMKHRGQLVERELEHVRAGIRKFIDAIKDGFTGPELKAEMDEQGIPARAMAAAGRAGPAAASQPGRSLSRESHSFGREHFRMPRSVRSSPKRFGASWTPSSSSRPDNELRIELKGDLAAMLSAAQNAKRSPEGDLSLQIAMVAGARNHLNLEFCWAAA